MATPERFAADFLTAAETGWKDVHSPEYDADPRAAKIAQALRAAGVTQAHVLGSGSFGLAAAMQDGRVVKLTTDESEVAAGHVLLGRQLRHVAHVYGAWFVRGVHVDRWDVEAAAGAKGRVGLLITERVAPLDVKSGGGAEITRVWKDIRRRFGASPESLALMTHAESRKILRLASKQLESELRYLADTQQDPIAHQVADALRELRGSRVYSIDVHAGNVGYSHQDGVFKVFDIGSSSSPAGEKPPELPHVSRMTRGGMVEEGVEVGEIGEDVDVTARAVERVRSQPTVQAFFPDGVVVQMPLDPTARPRAQWATRHEYPVQRVRVADLVARQQVVGREKVVEYLTNGWNEPIMVEMRGDGAALIVDGHHRAYAAYLRGDEYIDAYVVPMGQEVAEEGVAEDRKRRKTLRVDKLIVGREAMAQALWDVGAGRVSRTKAPLDVWYKPDCAGQPVDGYLLTDGHHRLVELLMRGPAESFTWSEVDVRQVGSGYNDYWRTPAPEERFVFTKTRYGGLEALADEDILATDTAKLVGGAAESVRTFYHGSMHCLPVGAVLKPARQRGVPRGELLTDREHERRMERLRPAGAVTRLDAVFMTDSVDSLFAAGGVPFYVYKVEPIGRVDGPYDGGWLKQALHGRTAKERNDAVHAYWSGAPCDSKRGCVGTTEYLAEGGARIVELVARNEQVWDDEANVNRWHPKPIGPGDEDCTSWRWMGPPGGVKEAAEDVIKLDRDAVYKGAERVVQAYARTLKRVPFDKGAEAVRTWFQIEASMVEGEPTVEGASMTPFYDYPGDLKDVRGNEIEVRVMRLLVLREHNYGLIVDAFTQAVKRGRAANIWIRINLGSPEIEKLRDQPELFVPRFASIFLHELTHVRDVIKMGHVVAPEDNREAYYNSDHEVRAYGRQIVEDVIIQARFNRDVRLAPTNEQLVERALANSQHWLQVEPWLTDENKEKIYRFVYRGLEREGLFKRSGSMRLPRTQRSRAAEDDGKPEILLTEAQIEVARDNKLVGFIRMEAIDFLRLTIDARDDDSAEGFVHALGEYQKLAKPLAQYNEWTREGKIRIAPGLGVTPNGHVVSHEGRHRAAALVTAAGEDAVMLVGIELKNDDGYNWSPRAMRNPARLRNVPPVFYGQWLHNRDIAVPVTLDGAMDLYEGDSAREARASRPVAREADGRIARKDCSHIQDWLYDYLNTEVDPYDFNFAVKDWIEQEEITDNGTPYVDPTEVYPEDLSPEQLKAFTKWLKKSGELEMYTREMPFESPAYLTLHAKSKLPRGSWFIHFTNAPSFEHFTQGATLDGLHLSTWKKRKDLANCSKNLSDTQGLAEVVFGFAYPAENVDTMRDVMAGAHKYGNHAVVFQCDCAVEAYHDGDEEYQGIFPVCSDYNLREISISSYLGVGLDETGNGDIAWFKTLGELTAHLENAKPKRRRTRAAREGRRPRTFKVGDRVFFEYHCWQDEESSDAELWHHTRQWATVLHVIRPPEVDEEVAPMYRVRFEDGFEYDVNNDEITAEPVPDPEKRGVVVPTRAREDVADAAPLPFALVRVGDDVVPALIVDNEGDELVGVDARGRSLSFGAEDIVGLVNAEPAAVYYGVRVEAHEESMRMAAEAGQPGAKKGDVLHTYPGLKVIKGGAFKVRPRGERFQWTPEKPRGLTAFPEVKKVLMKQREGVPSLESIRMAAIFAGLTVHAGTSEAEDTFGRVVAKYKALHGSMPPVEEIQQIIGTHLPAARLRMYETVLPWAVIVQDAMKRGLRDRELRRFLWVDVPADEQVENIGLAKMSFALMLMGQNVMCADSWMLGYAFAPDPSDAESRRPTADRISSMWKWSPAKKGRELGLRRYEQVEDAILKGNPWHEPGPIDRAHCQWVSWEFALGVPAAHRVWLDLAKELQAQGEFPRPEVPF